MCNFSYRLERSKRKTISIQVYFNGLIKVRSPLKCSQSEIEGYIEKNKKWLENQLKRLENIKNKSSDLIDYKKVLILGSPHEIIYSAIKKNSFFEGQFFLKDEKGRSFVKSYLNAFSQNLLEEKLAFWTKKTGFFLKGFTLGNFKSKWGSCDSNGLLKFNWRIGMLDESLVDYIVVHELSHLRHLNHSKRFWESVETFLPDYSIKRKLLKDFSFLTELY